MRVLFLATILCLTSFQVSADAICPGCDSNQLQVIKDGIEDAIHQASYAVTHLEETSEGQRKYAERFVEWVKEHPGFETLHYLKMKSKFRSIFNALNAKNFYFVNATLDEEEDNCVENETAMYVDWEDIWESDHRIHICQHMWNGNRTKEYWGGVIIHELSHFNDIGGTNDYAYSIEDCKNLDWSEGYRNAHTYFWFARNEGYLPMETHAVGDRLLPGLSIRRISLTAGEERHFRIEVPQGVPDITVTLEPHPEYSYGDADLYLQEWGWPDVDDEYGWDARSWNWGNNESIGFVVDEGTYYITVHAYTDFAGVNLTVTYN